MIYVHRNDEDGWIVLVVEDQLPELVSLPGRLRGFLERPDFSDRLVACLFPQAYRDDDDAEAEYQRLLRDDLVRRKLDAIEAVENALARRERHRTEAGIIVELHLSDEDLSLWLGFLHDTRLTIGAALGIEDESWECDLDPHAEHFEEMLLLNKLSYCEETIIQALRDAENLGES